MRNVGKVISVFLFLHVWVATGWSQAACTTLGQTPFTAFPVCGKSVFEQKTVPLCRNGAIPATGCGAGYDDQNPFWYKFTCFTGGTLGFLISPKTGTDDYDWEIFDITGHNPSDVYTDPSLIVSFNWSGTPGTTGADSRGKNMFECGSTPASSPSPYSSMPTLIKGHNYLLLISHFQPDSQSGYDLSFQGGTAVITDPSIPGIQNAYGVCDGTKIVVKLNKKMKCSSIAADGTDFSVSGPVPVSIVSATGNGCTRGFDMDSVVLTLNRALTLGTYTITSKVGTDDNSLIDNCDNSLATGLQTSLKFTPAQPTPMDSISPVVCITDSLQLVFSKPINCNSIAADGTDFVITGPAAVNIQSAKGVCSNGVSTVINILLSAPVKVNGTFTIKLRNGSDGNTLIDACSETTPAGSALSFTTKNITVADFQSTVATGCKYDTLSLSHNGNGAANKWQWRIDSNAVTTLQNPVIISKAFGPHTVSLAVTNGICTDTASKVFTLPDLTVKAAFAVADSLCPTDSLHFTDKSSANTTSWRWDFGNGAGSFSQNPPGQYYPLTGRPTSYTTRLTVQNNFNCTDIAYKIITVLASCYIAVPSAFTPNGDGLNDYLYPLNAFKADNLLFRVYNRYGQLIFETKDYSKKWDGRINGIPQGSGTYVWTLSYTDRNTGQKLSFNGTTVLIR